jgi:hypothetical protein
VRVSVVRCACCVVRERARAVACLCNNLRGGGAARLSHHNGVVLTVRGYPCANISRRGGELLGESLEEAAAAAAAGASESLESRAAAALAATPPGAGGPLDTGDFRPRRDTVVSLSPPGPGAGTSRASAVPWAGHATNDGDAPVPPPTGIALSPGSATGGAAAMSTLTEELRRIGAGLLRCATITLPQWHVLEEMVLSGDEARARALPPWRARVTQLCGSCMMPSCDALRLCHTRRRCDSVFVRACVCVCVCVCV